MKSIVDEMPCRTCLHHKDSGMVLDRRINSRKESFIMVLDVLLVELRLAPPPRFHIDCMAKDRLISLTSMFQDDFIQHQTPQVCIQSPNDKDHLRGGNGKDNEAVLKMRSSF